MHYGEDTAVNITIVSQRESSDMGIVVKLKKDFIIKSVETTAASIDVGSKGSEAPPPTSDTVRDILHILLRYPQYSLEFNENYFLNLD